MAFQRDATSSPRNILTDNRCIRHAIPIGRIVLLLRLRASLARSEISEGHARAILSVPEERRRQVWERIVRDGLSVRQTEELARDWPLGGQRRRARRPSKRNAEIEALEERLRVALGTRVSVVKGRRGGRITVHFYSDEELDGLLDRLGVAER